MKKSTTENNDPLVAGMPTMPDLAPRPTVSAAAALGLPENPHDTVANTVSELRRTHKLNGISPLKKEEIKETESEKPAKTEKAVKEDKKAVSSKPKIISEKPVDSSETKKENDEEEISTEETEAQTDNKTESVKASTETTNNRIEDSEAFKKLAKENEDLRKRVEEVLVAHKANTAPKAEAPKQEPVKALSKEEVKAQEQSWINDVTQYLEAELTEEDHNAILDGGPKAVAKMVEMRKRDMAQSILKARQSVYSELNPVIDQVMGQIQRMAPVYDDYVKTQSYRVEQSFQSSYPELKPYMDTARAVAKALVEKHPNEMSRMSEQETFAEVQKQTVSLLKTFGITVQPVTAAAPAATPAAVPVTAPSVPVAAPQAAAPAAKPAPTPKAPGATSPGAIPQGGNLAKEKHRAIAESLQY